MEILKYLSSIVVIITAVYSLFNFLTSLSIRAVSEHLSPPFNLKDKYLGVVITTFFILGVMIGSFYKICFHFIVHLILMLIIAIIGITIILKYEKEKNELFKNGNYKQIPKFNILVQIILMLVPFCIVTFFGIASAQFIVNIIDSITKKEVPDLYDILGIIPYIITPIILSGFIYASLQFIGLKEVVLKSGKSSEIDGLEGVIISENEKEVLFIPNGKKVMSIKRDNIDLIMLK